jgi:hypothetical protein
MVHDTRSLKQRVGAHKVRKADSSTTKAGGSHCRRRDDFMIRDSLSQYLGFVMELNYGGGRRLPAETELRIPYMQIILRDSRSAYWLATGCVYHCESDDRFTAC